MVLLARQLVQRVDGCRVFSSRAIHWHGKVRPNHNRLLGQIPGVDGIKTGYTVPAGFNLAASARRGGRRVIVVVLGARTAAARNLLITKLLEEDTPRPRWRAPVRHTRHPRDINRWTEQRGAPDAAVCRATSAAAAEKPSHCPRQFL